MKTGTRCRLLLILASMLGAAIVGPWAVGAGPQEHPYRYSDVDLPVSLAPGTVQTPQFPVVKEPYFIMIQVEKPLPFIQMKCMMGVTHNRLESKGCHDDDPLVRADWTVWDGDQVISTGSSSPVAHAVFTNENIFKILGSFVASEAGAKYVVEVRFTHDGTALNVANPHLIVIRTKYH